MILLCGIPSERPLSRVREELEALRTPYLLFNQRRFAGMEMELEIRGGEPSGFLELDGRRHALEECRGVYTRLMDDQRLPELAGEPADSPTRRRCRALHDVLVRWAEITPARVVNRAGPMGSNASKPYQQQLIREHGFAVPETLVTNDPEAVLAFRESHGRVVYKSVSGIRSIVNTLEADDLPRLECIRWCPTQFQAYVPGTDVRVHVIGRALFATAIRAAATDYRYAARQGSEAELEAVDLPAELAERCLGLAHALGLAFAGIDLRLTPEGEAYCFEVNPSPAFTFYEAHTGQPIARALALYLAGLS